jgi:hypothetical protein
MSNLIIAIIAFLFGLSAGAVVVLILYSFSCMIEEDSIG